MGYYIIDQGSIDPGLCFFKAIDLLTDTLGCISNRIKRFPEARIPANNRSQVEVCLGGDHRRRLPRCKVALVVNFYLEFVEDV